MATDVTGCGAAGSASGASIELIGTQIKPQVDDAFAEPALKAAG